MFSKAFLKDFADRVLSTFVAVFVGVVASGNGFEMSMLGDWKFWAPILITTAVTVAKALGLGIANPNTGASFGTTVPGDLVAAQTDTGGSHPGDTGPIVAGPAAANIPNGDPVQIVPGATP